MIKRTEPLPNQTNLSPNAGQSHLGLVRLRSFVGCRQTGRWAAGLSAAGLSAAGLSAAGLSAAGLSAAGQRGWLGFLLLMGWIAAGCGADVRGQDQVPPLEKQLILPGESFTVEGRTAFIFWPQPEQRRQPQPWVMYAPTLPAYPDTHERWLHQQFLDAGIAVAGIDMGEAYGSPAGTAGLTALYRHLTDQRGFAVKPCLLGRSRGGLWVSSWAIAHPDKVAGILGIYPVFDLRSYPGLERAAPAYGLTPEQLAAELARHNPIENAAVLAKHKIPIAIIHGDMDTVVPLTENSQRLADVYRDEGAQESMHLEVVAGQGHNYWQGFFESPRLVELGIQWANAGAK
jgi:pimeloyl-ACP methyl ester carboxylesterase